MSGDGHCGACRSFEEYLVEALARRKPSSVESFVARLVVRFGLSDAISRLGEGIVLAWHEAKSMVETQQQNQQRYRAAEACFRPGPTTRGLQPPGGGPPNLVQGLTTRPCERSDCWPGVGRWWERFSRARAGPMRLTAGPSAAGFVRMTGTAPALCTADQMTGDAVRVTPAPRNEAVCPEVSANDRTTLHQKAKRPAHRSTRVPYPLPEPPRSPERAAVVHAGRVDGVDGRSSCMLCLIERRPPTSFGLRVVYTCQFCTSNSSSGTVKFSVPNSGCRSTSTSPSRSWTKKAT